jgi:hypothetical protein
VSRTARERRCRTIRLVQTLKDDLSPQSTGSIRCERDDLGRRLIFVYWEQGFPVPVFPQESALCAEADVILSDEVVIQDRENDLGSMFVHLES